MKYELESRERAYKIGSKNKIFKMAVEEGRYELRGIEPLQELEVVRNSH